MMVLIEFIVVVFVVARISRFGAQDLLTEPFRQWVVRKLPRQHLLAKGVFCRWCWSVWAAGPTVFVWWLISDTPHLWDRWYTDIPGLVLAVSYATALTERAEPED